MHFGATFTEVIITFETACHGISSWEKAEKEIIVKRKIVNLL